jgi:nicotinate-nucleotide adenylyltransferase
MMCNSAAEIPRFELFIPAQSGLPAENGRLGVLGSAYNPITRAHLLLARSARAQFQLNEVIFVLPKILPNKPLVGISLEQRLEMMQLAVRNVPYISLGLCTHGLFLEICTALQELFPQKPEIFFITGRDAAERILTWPYDDPAASLAQMFNCFQLLVFEREGKLELPDKPLIQQYSNYIHVLETEENLDRISSTEVRRRIVAGLPIDDLVPPAVANFIETSNVYKDIAKE